MNKDNHYVIYDLINPEYSTDPSASPSHIIYPKQLDAPVYSKHFRVDGERIKTIYYAEFDEETKKYSRPVIKETYTFTRAEGGLPRFVDIKICWMLKSGSWSSESKEIRKYFTDTQKKLDEIKLRRSNLISEVSGQAADFGLASAIEALFDKYFVEIGKYKESGSTIFRDSIQSDDELEFLDYPTRTPGVDIRTWLVVKFSIGT